MGLREVFFFLLLVFSCGIADAKFSVVLDLEKSRVPNPDPIYEVPTIENKIPEALERNSPLCSVCENFMTQAVNYLSEKQTQDEIMGILHAACSQTFSLEQKCVQLVDSYATLLFSKIAEIQLTDFCKQYGLCEDRAYADALRTNSTCVFCRHLVDEVLSKLKDPDAEFEILQLLLKECNKIEGHVQQCKRLVLQYVPLILVNGEKFLEKNDVCATIRVCEASQKRTICVFAGEELLLDA